MASQLVGVVSAVGIVAAFAALQFDLVGPHDLRYLSANLFCAGALTVIAVLAAQYGFVISNGFWTLVAAAGILRVTRSRKMRGSRREWKGSRPGEGAGGLGEDGQVGVEPYPVESSDAEGESAHNRASEFR